MAIAQMTKIMIVSHRSESQELLEALQVVGVVQVLNAEQAMVTKEWPELQVPGFRDKGREELLSSLSQGIDFLSGYYAGKDLTTVLRPRVVVGKDFYDKTAKGKLAVDLLKTVQDLQQKIDIQRSKIEECQGKLNMLSPWQNLSIPVEDLYDLEKATTFAGVLRGTHIEDTINQVQELGGCVERVSEGKAFCACIIVCLHEKFTEIQKALRAADFDSVNFDGLEGSVQQIIEQTEDDLGRLENKLADLENNARELANRKVELQILFDHLSNELSRDKTLNSAPATKHAVLHEGWVRTKDFGKVKKVVSRFPSSCVSPIEPGEDEEVPVMISNNPMVKPFEVITRLYGMPKSVELDPTVLLTPFFALFFALCLTDAGYGIVLVGVCAYILKKMQASSRLVWMLLLCSALTIAAGALTGGWFGAGLEELAKAKQIDWLANAIDKMRLFDPLSNPMPFLKLSILLGYIQIMVGLFAGFIHNFMRKSYIAGLCDHFSWILMLNCTLLLVFADKVPAPVVSLSKILIPVGAILVVSGSHREGGIAARIGMGLYNLTGAIFYVGDILSYLRLMALGLGTAGVAIAVNIIAKLTADIPYVGFILAAIVLILGHLFNIAMSGLGAFIHSLRLQFVEFFPKFMEGGGTEFMPLAKEYKHIYVESGK